MPCLGSVTCCETQIKGGRGGGARQAFFRMECVNDSVSCADQLAKYNSCLLNELHPGDAGMSTTEVVLLPRSLSLDPGSF